MNVRMVLALGENREIGKGGSLLWNLPSDMQHFKNLTTGKPVIMGRKTFESVGKPLPERTNIVITRNAYFEEKGCKRVHSLEDAFQEALKENPEEICIIGGGEICELALPYVAQLSLTFVHGSFPEADAFFPVITESDWRGVSDEYHVADETNEYAFTFVEFERITPVKPLPVMGTANTEHTNQKEEVEEKIEEMDETEIEEEDITSETGESEPEEENTSVEEIAGETILDEVDHQGDDTPDDKIESETEGEIEEADAPSEETKEDIIIETPEDTMTESEQMHSEQAREESLQEETTPEEEMNDNVDEGNKGEKKAPTAEEISADDLASLF